MPRLKPAARLRPRNSRKTRKGTFACKSSLSPALRAFRVFRGPTGSVSCPSCVSWFPFAAPRPSASIIGTVLHRTPELLLSRFSRPAPRPTGFPQSTVPVSTTENNRPEHVSAHGVRLSSRRAASFHAPRMIRGGSRRSTGRLWKRRSTLSVPSVCSVGHQARFRVLRVFRGPPRPCRGKKRLATPAAGGWLAVP